MLNVTRKSKTLILTLFLTIILGTVLTFAATELIEAKKGGSIGIAEGVQLKILPNALEEDTMISAQIYSEQTDSEEYIYFIFGPEGTEFSDNKPARLCVSWEFIDDAEDFTLYGENGTEIKPKIKGWGIEWHIPDFSIYYFRRR